MSCCNDNSSCNTDTTVEYKICTREGKDQNLGFRFIDSDGNNIPLDTVERVIFTSRFSYKGSIVLQLECVIVEDDPVYGDYFYIPFTSENTSGLAGRRGCASYKYDIEFEYTGGGVIPYLEGDWIVNPDVPTLII